MTYKKVMINLDDGSFEAIEIIKSHVTRVMGSRFSLSGLVRTLLKKYSEDVKNGINTE